MCHLVMLRFVHAKARGTKFTLKIILEMTLVYEADSDYLTPLCGLPMDNPPVSA